MSFRGKEFVVIDGVATDSFGVYVKDRPPVQTAERDVEHIEVRGREGSLTKLYGYQDVEYMITMHMYEDGDVPFMPSFRAIKNRLLGAKTLAFSDDLKVYRKVKNVAILEAYNPTKEFGRFDVVFSLDPFQYEIDNPVQTITSRTIVTNEGYESEPIMTVHCSGTGKVYVNDVPITITNINGTITIDSEMMNAYRMANGYITNLNNHMIGDFPVLRHGDNIIDFDGGIERLEVIPNRRWV